MPSRSQIPRGQKVAEEKSYSRDQDDAHGPRKWQVFVDQRDEGADNVAERSLTEKKEFLYCTKPSSKILHTSACARVSHVFFYERTRDYWLFEITSNTEILPENNCLKPNML
jgi:hypothetical protein